MKKLSVRARGLASVPHFETLGTATRRFIGRKWDDGSQAWVATGEVEFVPTIPETMREYRELWGEYRREVREGALWPADKETAEACGVPFDPKFGGADPAPSPVPTHPEADLFKVT